MPTPSRERPSPSKVPPKPRLRINTGPSYLLRLGVLYAHPLRMKIVSELYMREMSPTQAHEEFGADTSYGAMLKHFKMLEEHGWLRWVRQEQAVPGSGRPRDLYRATELAVVDDDTWEELPPSLQVAFTARTLQQLGERVGGGLAEGSVDRRKDRFFDCRSLALDARRWRAAMDALADCFHSHVQEQVDAKIRLEKSQEPGFLMTTVLTGFQSAARVRSGTPQADLAADTPGVLRLDAGTMPLSTRMAKVFADSINLEIVKVLHLEALTPSQLQARLGGASARAYWRRCRALTELGWLIKTTDPEAPPGAYRAAGPQVFDDADIWTAVPEGAEKAESWPIFHEFCAKASDALKQGCFNAQPIRHVTWCTFLLDERGWKQVIRSLRICHDRLSRIATESQRRIEPNHHSNALLPATFFLAGFEDAMKWQNSAAIC
jgi:DNA-binding HxlR family transcriptional regulator